MAIEVTLPQLGESVVEGTISKWLVAEGDSVTKEQPLLEVATDKADSEIPSPVSGTVTKIVAQAGTTVPVKSVLCVIEAGDVAPKSKSKAESAPEAKPDSQRSKEPKPVAEAAPGAVAAPQPVTTKQAAAAAHAETGATAARSAFGGPLASPDVRRLAREQGVDASELQGSGEHGRVTRDDVMRAKGEPRERKDVQYPVGAAPARSGGGSAGELQQLISAAMAEGKSVYVPPIPNVGYGAYKVPPYVEKPGDRLVPFSRRRRLTAAHMVYSKQTSPQVVTVAEVDLQATVRLREQHKDRYKKEGIGLTYLAFIVHATAIALKENPALNARVLDDAYVLLRDINLGVAVDTKDGLVVPVIRRVDGLNVRGVAQAIDEYAGKARDGKLTPDDLSGASFSVTNPGLKGNLFGGAIINQPNVGILRIGELKKRVVVVEAGGMDTIAIHPVMFMALSYDHRVVDGVAANAFLWRVRELLEKGEFEV
ncbi:MAG: 2-oxoglutarate dehydrogenase, E2 component, dihydrolipoamide succinyltransferase [Polyangiales bacterium]